MGMDITPPVGQVVVEGGDAGLDPSNVTETPYALGAIMVSGETPIIVGPDGPSLGGFAAPLCVAIRDRWKIGQLRPGDHVRLVPGDESGTVQASGGAVRGGHLPVGLREAILAEDPAPIEAVDPDAAPQETVGLQPIGAPVLYRVQLDIGWGEDDYARSLRFATLRARLPTPPAGALP